MKKCLFILLMLLCITVQAQNTGSKVADSVATVHDTGYVISLLTCSPGNESYTSWGHSALRVIDTISHKDMVFNFGMFDFNTPNFYGKFVKGNLMYFLGVQHTQPFIDLYVNEGRCVQEQILNLNPIESQMIYHRLLYLYRPENRYYRYGFVEDNCTTALRELILSLVDTDFDNTLADTSWRTLFNSYLHNQLWLRFGVNLILGQKVDKPITIGQTWFLPDYLHDGFAKLQKKEGGALIASEVVYNEVKREHSRYPFWKLPVLWCWLICALAIVLQKKRGWQISVYLLAALCGIFLLVVSLISEHPEVRENLNILWLNPLYLLAAWFVIRKNVKAMRICAWILAAFIVATGVIWMIGLQEPDPAFAPLVVALAVSLRPYLVQISSIKMKPSPPAPRCH